MRNFKDAFILKVNKQHTKASCFTLEDLLNKS